MLVNFGVGGGWYQPSTNGQGFSIDIVPSGNQLVAYWFTYDSLGSQREWFVAQGDIDGPGAGLLVYRASGGIFDTPSAVDVEVVGTAKLHFRSCQAADFEYELDDVGLQGVMELVRLGPVEFCEALLPSAHLEAVTHRKAWLNLAGEWRFEGCVELGGGQSHGDERFLFDETIIRLEIEEFSQAACGGEPTLRVLEFDYQRVGISEVLLEGLPVTANRFRLADRATGQEVKQVWYVDDRADEVRITHGVLDSPPDSEGYPTEVHSLFATR